MISDRIGLLSPINIFNIMADSQKPTIVKVNVIHDIKR